MAAQNMIWILGELRRSLAQARASNSKLTSNLSPGLQPFPRDLIGIVFCSNLTQASLGFNLDYSAFNYLSEYLETFKGLSEVKQLALEPKIIWDDGSINSRGWKRWRVEESILVGGKLETAAFYHFLQVTNSTLPLPSKNEVPTHSCVPYYYSFYQSFQTRNQTTKTSSFSM